jgi:hypothetical protein
MKRFVQFSARASMLVLAACGGGSGMTTAPDDHTPSGEPDNITTPTANASVSRATGAVSSLAPRAP